jgi:predicted ATPase/class 3 adenylate cyclase
MIAPVRPDLPSGTVTFLFTDVEGSTALLHELGAAGYAQALSEHRRLVRAAIGSHGGVEVDTQGDAFFVAFPTAPGALSAAAAARDGLATGPIRVRMGIHTGTPHLGEEGYVGVDVHRAARIAAAGHGGQVLVSASTAQLVALEIRDLGEHRLKDLSAPERLFQLGEGEFPPLKSLYRTNVPVPATPFLGRDAELAEVGALLARPDVRLLTLTGPGGTGKTRLALQAAAEASDAYPDGVFWVPLTPLRDPALMLEEASRAVGANDGLAEHVSDKRLLLLFDNFEHLIAAAPDLAGPLAACPNLRLMVTSREPLHLSGEQEYPVPPLAHDEGEQLFSSRARAVKPDFAFDAAVPEICRRLDDLPLALELAAARIKALSPEQILQRLEQRLPLLTGGARDLPERQRTLRATIQWSYELLQENEQCLFARLAVFRGGCTLEAAEDICDADLDTLQSLVDKSLLRYSEERYWMLETIREYATERLEASGEAGELRRIHAGHFLRVAESSRRLLRGGDQANWLTRMLLEDNNLRVALEWALVQDDPELALRFGFALEVFWIRAVRPTEAEGWIERILNIGDPDPSILWARALATGAVFTSSQERKAERLATSIPVLREHGDEEGLAFALRAAAWMYVERGDLDLAREALEEAIPLFERVGQPVTTRLSDIGGIMLKTGDRARARVWLRRALEAATSEQDAGGLMATLCTLGDLELADGNLREAEQSYRNAMTVARELAPAWVLEVTPPLASLLFELGEINEAKTLLREAELLAENVDVAVWRAYEESLAPVVARLGREQATNDGGET